MDLQRALKEVEQTLLGNQHDTIAYIEQNLGEIDYAEVVRLGLQQLSDRVTKERDMRNWLEAQAKTKLEAQSKAKLGCDAAVRKALSEKVFTNFEELCTYVNDEYGVLIKVEDLLPRGNAIAINVNYTEKYLNSFGFSYNRRSNIIEELV